MLTVLAVLTTMHYEGDVTAAGGDYAEVAFEVPAGTVEIQIAHDDGSGSVILDFGVWSPEGFRGWGGGNSEDIVIGVDESARSYRIGPITPGTWTLVIGKAKLEQGMGRYSVDVTCRDDATLPGRPRGAFEPVVLSPERRWYKGDFHVHSRESGDATATYEQITTLARQRGLDFVNLSEHNTDAQYPLQAAAQTDVLLLRGAEITTYAGHANAVGLASYVDHRIGVSGRTIEDIVADVGSQSALFIVNHPALDLGDSCIGCAWNHPATPWSEVNGMEIITGKWEVAEPTFVPTVIAQWDALLDQSHRIAAIGGSDDHRAGMGTGTTDTPLGSPTTLVLADNLSEAAIIEGVRRGRTIVQMRGPDDPLVEMRIDDAEIGDTIEKAGAFTISASVTGAEPGMVLQLWENGQLRDQQPAAEASAFEITPTARRVDRYRLELVSGGQRIVVTSHIYVSVTAVPDPVEPGDEGGCCGTSTPTASLAPLLLVLANRRRRRVHPRQHQAR